MWPWEENLEKWTGGSRERFERRLQESDRNWQGLKARWQEWAGNRLDGMLANRQVAVQSMSHHEASVRRCAASVLLHHWNVRPGEGGAEGIYQMAMTDPDAETRVIAVRALGNCYENTDDVTVGRGLALTVRDEGLPPLLRTFAYYALFNVRGLQLPWISPTARGEKPRLPRAPEEVDWSFVESFLADGRTPMPTDWLRESMPERVYELAQSYAMGDKAYHLGRYEEAVSLFSKAITLKPDITRVYYMRARALLRLERFDDAIRDLAIVINSLPDWAPAYDERAQAYKGKGLIDKARADERVADEIRRETG